MADETTPPATPQPNGYQFSATDLSTLLLRRYYPERTNNESTVIRDFLLARGANYDLFEFSVRVGQGNPPDPEHLPGVQQTTTFSSQKRIDLIVWKGPQPWIVEVKIRVTHASLGQLRTYAHLLLEDRPAMPAPGLIAIGRYSDADTLRVLGREGIDVFLYEETTGE